MYRVYGDKRSGNCYKVQLMMHLLGHKYEWVNVDILRGDTQTKAYLAMNPIGKVPLLEARRGQFLSESNAIINFLADGTSYVPNAKFVRAKSQQWQFFEQYSHEPYIAVARYINLYLGLPESRKAEYEGKQAGGHKALLTMEKQLKQTPFIAGNLPTTADISLFAYTHVAHQGGFDLSRYPAIVKWINQIQSLDNFIPMQA